MDTKSMSTAEILAEIDRYQAIQKQRPPTSDIWQDCSSALADLFDEMAARTHA